MILNWGAFTSSPGEVYPRSKVSPSPFYAPNMLSRPSEVCCLVKIRNGILAFQGPNMPSWSIWPLSPRRGYVRVVWMQVSTQCGVLELLYVFFKNRTQYFRIFTFKHTEFQQTVLVYFVLARTARGDYMCLQKY